MLLGHFHHIPVCFSVHSLKPPVLFPSQYECQAYKTAYKTNCKGYNTIHNLPPPLLPYPKTHVQIFFRILCFPVIMTVIIIFAISRPLLTPFFAFIISLLLAGVMVCNIGTVRAHPIHIKVFFAPCLYFFVEFISLFDFVYYFFWNFISDF